MVGIPFFVFEKSICSRRYGTPLDALISPRRLRTVRKAVRDDSM